MDEYLIGRMEFGPALERLKEARTRGEVEFWRRVMHASPDAPRKEVAALRARITEAYRIIDAIILEVGPIPDGQTVIDVVKKLHKLAFKNEARVAKLEQERDAPRQLWGDG